MSALYMVVLLGGLVLIHELGHYLLARACGVHVTTFSIGFGPVLFKVKGRARNLPDGLEPTEYCLAAIPFGGYVAMYGADPEEDIPDAHRQVSFQSKSVGQRFLVMAAGPAFNLVLPLVIFFAFFAAMDRETPSVLGQVDAASPAAAAGLQSGDRITAIDGEPVRFWFEISDKVSARPGETFRVAYDRRGEALATDVTAGSAPDRLYKQIGIDRYKGRIGIAAGHTGTVVTAHAGSAADAAGLAFWDRVTAVDGEAVDRYHRVAELLVERKAQPVTLTVARHAFSGDPKQLLDPPPPATVEITLPAAKGERADALRGLRSADCVVSKVFPGSPAAELGLEAGDVLVGLDERACPDSIFLLSSLRGTEAMHTLTFERAGQKQVVQKTMAWVRDVAIETAIRKGQKVPMFGVDTFNVYEGVDPEPYPAMAYALSRTWSATGERTEHTLLSILGLFTQRVDFDELSGPVGIAQLAAHFGEQGWGPLFQLMAFLSISLGLINLLPIPLLDGGHILFLGLEAIRRRPVSLRTRQIATYAGFAFIVLVMVAVLRNDVARWWTG